MIEKEVGRFQVNVFTDGHPIVIFIRDKKDEHYFNRMNIEDLQDLKYAIERSLAQLNP